MTTNKRLFLWLFVGVFFSTIIGILFHEFGHWTGATLCGRDARIHYNYTSITPSENDAWRKQLRTEYIHEVDFWTVYPPLSAANEIHVLMVQDVIGTLLGPLFTILVSVVAFALLLRSRIQCNEHVTIQQWVCLLVAFFCIRGILALIKDTFQFAKARLTGGRLRASLFSDEMNLSESLQWNRWSLPVLSAVISCTIIWLTVRSIPKAERILFIKAYIGGCIAVVLIWLFLLGPLMLP